MRNAECGMSMRESLNARPSIAIPHSPFRIPQWGWGWDEAGPRRLALHSPRLGARAARRLGGARLAVAVGAGGRALPAGGVAPGVLPRSGPDRAARGAVRDRAGG